MKCTANVFLVAAIANVKEFMPTLRPASLLMLFMGLLSFSGCETDIDVIAPKRDMTIIYGLLEANKTRHHIRINRSFVGEEAASVLATKPGINEYADDELQARIIELFEDGTPSGATWELQSMFIDSKDEGTFNNDSNKIYYFDATLDVERLYKIECKIKVDGEEEKTVTATTDILGSKAANGGLEQLVLVRPKRSGSGSTNQGSDRTSDEVVFVIPSGYAPEFQVQWSGAKGGVRYTTYARLYYKDVDPVAGEVIRKDSVTLPMGTREFAPDAGNASFSVNTQDIYSTIGIEVPDHAITDDFIRIVSDTLQFFVEIANEELSTYIAINQPITEVVQERPEYTNIDNGIGIFASRLVASTRHSNPLLTGRILDNRSMEELLYSNASGSGGYTVTKNFTNDRCVVSITGPNCD